MRELRTLEVDRWEPSEKKGMVKHVGMVSPQQAFDALKKHLEEIGLMPDEYFLSDEYSWKDIKELPNYIRASCDVNWGGSEGIYLDVVLLYRDENKHLQHFNLATGKTLGESGDDFLRMSRIAAECSMMLNGRGGLVRFQEEDKYIINATTSLDKSLDEWPGLVADLIATYEDLYHVSESHRVTEWIGDYSLHDLKSENQGVSRESIKSVYKKALNAIGMSSDEFVSKREQFLYRKPLIELMKSKMPESLESKIAGAETFKDVSVQASVNKDRCSENMML